MANRIEFVASLNAAPFAAGLAALESAADKAQARLALINRAGSAGIKSQNDLYIERELAEWRAFETQRSAQRAKATAEEMLYFQAFGRMSADKRQKEEAETAAMLARFEKQKIAAAALKAEQLADLTSIARNGGVSFAGATGHFAPGGGGSFSGTIRESFVLLREAGRGNWSRMAGSLTLLAGYTGTLGKFFRSTAAGAVELFEKENKLAVQQAITALQAEKAATAAAADATMTKVETEALQRNAIASREAATAQALRAKETAEAAEIELSSAKFSVTALGWIVGAVAILGFALYELLRHWNKVAAAQKEFNDSLSIKHRLYEDEVRALDEINHRNVELNNWMQKELSNRKDLLDIMQQRIDKLHEESEAQVELMRARGASATEINNFEIQQLEMEKKILQATQAQAEANYSNAQAKLASAQTGLNDFTREGALMSATAAQETAAKYMDTLAQQAETNPAIQQLRDAAKFKGENSPIGTTAPGWLYRLPYIANNMSWKDAINAYIEHMPQQLRLSGGGSMGTSIADVRERFGDAGDAVARLTFEQDKLQTAFSDAKDGVSTFHQDLIKTRDTLGKVNTELGIRSGAGAQTAALEDMKKRPGGGGSAVDGLIRAGNYMGLSASAIGSMQAKLVDINQKQLARLISIDNKMGGASGAPTFSF